VLNNQATIDIARVGQRSDLTFKHNTDQARHGWLRLTPAYSVKVVDAILRDQKNECSILDPFGGTSTTPLCAAYQGHRAVSTDINPFLVWFGQAKLRRYGTITLRQTREIAEAIQSLAGKGRAIACPPPPIANIERWWDKASLDYLCAIKGAIESQTFPQAEVKDLLLVAFCRMVIDLSNAAFNHQSMSFKDTGGASIQPLLWKDEYPEQPSFVTYVKAVTESASHNPSGDAQVFLCDARTLEKLPGTQFDLLITSPPYPNRMSYIRELRPYMYWLGYLNEAREAGELDWQAIGGTWGIATSRLSEWQRDALTFFPDYLEEILVAIAQSDGKSGVLLSKYVGKYFEDMWQHFLSAHAVVKPKGKLHYIIGNSKFYNCLVPAEKIFAEMLKQVGFKNIDIRVLRKRNSKKELFEFDVTAMR